MEADKTTDPVVTPVVTQPQVSQAPSSQWREKLFGGMSWYALELALSTFGLLVTIGIVNYSFFALINHWAGVDNQLAQRFMGEFSLWVVAMMIVWVPITLFFYLRARNESARHPASEKRFLHKLIVGLFSFWVVVALAGMVFSIVYSLLRMAIGVDENVSDTFLRAILPTVLSIVTTSGLLFAYTHHPRVSRKMFVIALGVLSALMVVALLAVSWTTIRGADRDQKAASDLQDITSKIKAYHSEKDRLPSSLSDLDGFDKEVKNRLSRYEYKKESGSKYQLCATFVTDTSKNDSYSSSYGEDYSTYASFSVHGTGEKCFKLTASYSSLYDDNSIYNSDYFKRSDDSSSY